jgi:hypothetical protein
MAQTSLLRPEGLVQSPAFSHFDMKAFRPVRMLGSVLALLAGVFWLERAWEVWDAKGEPLARYGNLLTGYGLGVFAEILLRVVLGAVLL